MNIPSYLPYVGIGILILLLIIFEIQDIQFGSGGVSNSEKTAYRYYTHNGGPVIIQHTFGNRYKVYVSGRCPVRTNQDRYGEFFTLRARTAAEIEHKIDEIYR